MKLIDWVDDRTGIRGLLQAALYEPVPGGARWRYVTGSMLVMAFLTQAITGVVLWMSYSPGTQNAWESVYFIQFQMNGGWFLRGLHHSMAQAMVVLLPIHLLQVVVDRAYVAPREFNYWFGLVLMLLVLALGLTGYLLPWDQKGYWATKVATNLMGLAPGGTYLQKLVVGGRDYGQHTLTHFFALHAGILPATLIVVLAGHLALFRKHGLKAHRPDLGQDQFFWPHQVWKDSAAFLVLLGIICFSVTTEGGAELGAPADPTEPYKAARPEWYFLFLFQLLKKFHSEFIGAIVVPGILFAFLCLLPILGKYRWGHRLNVGVLSFLVAGAAYLTCEALYEDNYARLFQEPSANASEAERQLYHDSRDYLESVEAGEKEADRVQHLAAHLGIPREGMLSRVRHDAEIVGPRLFRDQCASCHPYRDPEGKGYGPLDPPNGSGAPNLYAFGSRAWLAGMLNPQQIISRDYFGRSAQGQKNADGAYPSGGMVEFVHEHLATLTPEQQTALQELIAALSAEAGLVRQQQQDQADQQAGILARGREALTTTFECTNCHKFGEQGAWGSAPDLTGWGSEAWMTRMIANPNHEQFYQATNDRMPAFAEAHDPEEFLLTLDQIRLLARWIRQDDAH